jgi:signal transduction histidine kinase
MKSLHAWIFVSLAGTLLVALLVFVAISNHIQRLYLYPVFEGMDELELESAVDAFHQGGTAAVSAYMHHLDSLFSARHYLLTAAGTDVVSGRNFSSLLPQSRSVTKSRTIVKGRFIVTHRAADGRYWFLAVNPAEQNRWTFLPYYLVAIGMTGILYSLALAGMLRPLQRITGALDRFGHGDLFVRVGGTRKDEIGRLGRSFDEMAARIEVLLCSERRLLTDISHELRSPLTRLRFAVKLSETGGDVADTFGRVRCEIDRMTALVSELTELTRVEGDPPGRKLETVDLQSVVNETVRDCQLEAQYRGCTIEVRGRRPPVVEGDRELLRRAIENVLRNAIRYSPEQGSIECDLASDGSPVVVAIRDYGPGIPENMLTQIFEPFFRVEEEGTAKAGGLGLGLAIAKRAVQIHEGSIVAENAHPGLRIAIKIPVPRHADPLDIGEGVGVCRQ